jgi:iron complex outermembrane receptor protein
VNRSIFCSLRTVLVSGVALFPMTVAAAQSGDVAPANQVVQATMPASSGAPTGADAPGQRAMTTGATAPAGDVDSGEIVVTGSRVISDAANSPTPLVVVSTEQLLATTPTNIPEALNKLPVFLGSQSGRSTSNAGSNAAGNVLNLRNFGIQRTLVLLDGHRIAPSNANGTVDTDVLPLALMSRVDVVTGGASAVYGSDAITGVVNFVLDKKFSGIKYDFNGGISNFGDGKSYQASVAAGTDLFGGRGHLEGSFRFFNQERIPITARPFGEDGQAWEQSGAGTAANPYVNTPFSRLSNQAPNGLITCSGCAANGQQFVSPGVIGPFNPGIATGTGNLSSGGDGGYDRFGTYQAALRTEDAFARFSYDLTDTINFYVQGTAAKSHNYATWYPVNLSPGAGANRPNTFFTTNAFLTPTEQAQLANPTGKFVVASFINNIDGTDAGDQHRVYATVADQRYLSGTTGLSGQFGGKFSWDLYYTHGESRLVESNPNNTNNQKLYAAEDAVLDSGGHPVCYVSTTVNAGLYPGCVPINPFGGGTVTASQYDYFSEPTQFVLKNTMDDVGGSVSGEIFKLPAGAVKVALSGEYRANKYSVDSNASPTATVDCTGLRLCSPSAPLYVQNVIADISAKNNVYEIAGEANIPILKDVPLIQSLDANVAGRYTHYSTSGSVETWKVGVDYHVNDFIRFRGTASVDIRAPTLNDLFSPLQSATTGFTDLLTNQTASIPLLSQGNPNLKPEKAHTYTGGVVLRPLPGLTFSADYFKISVADGITNINYSTQAIQQLCMASGGSSPYCSLAIRPFPITNTSAANFPTAIISQNLNSSAVKTHGIDVEASYRFELSSLAGALPGSLSLRGFGTYQPTIKTVNFPGAPQNLAPSPTYRGSLFIGYNVGTWGINLQDTYLSSFKKATLTGQVFVIPKVPSFNTLDLTIDKKVELKANEFDVYLSVQNVGNRLYPLYPTNSQNPGLFYPTPSNFGNSMGRYFTVGIRGKF